MKHKRSTVGLTWAFIAVGCLLVRAVRPARVAVAQVPGWRVVRAPDPSIYGSRFHDVEAVSASNVWAVGFAISWYDEKTLIEHWDGSSWKVVPSPSPGRAAELFGVTSLPSGEVWGVGIYDDVPINTYDGTYNSPTPLVLRR